jgi:hypothetical protein
MALPGTIEGREYTKFTENSDGNTAVRVVLTDPAAGDVPAPTNLLLNGLTTVEFAEGQPALTDIGTLTSVASNPVTYTIEQDLDNAFGIDGNKLQSAIIFDQTAQPIYNVVIRVTDNITGKFSTQSFQINITDAAGFTNSLSFQFGGNGYIVASDTVINGNIDTAWWTWIKFNLDTVQHIYNSRSAASGTNPGVELILNTGGNKFILRTVRSNGNQKDYRYTLPPGFDLDAWHLIGFQTLNNFQAFYLDGTQQVPATINLDQTTNTIANTSQDVYFGSDGTGLA